MFIVQKYDFLEVAMENVKVVSTLLALRGDDGQRGGSAGEFIAHNKCFDPPRRSHSNFAEALTNPISVPDVR